MKMGNPGLTCAVRGNSLPKGATLGPYLRGRVAMDVDKTIAAVERYLRRFIVFILSFFKRELAKEEDEVYDDLNNTVIFSIMSAMLGAYMWKRYINFQLHDEVMGSKKGSGFAELVIDSLIRWISLGILLFAILAIFRIKARVVPTVIAVLKVYAISHVLAIYLAYVSINLVWTFSDEAFFKQSAPFWVAIVSYALNILFLTIFLPREILQISGVTELLWRKIAATVVFLGLLYFYFLIHLADWIF